MGICGVVFDCTGYCWRLFGSGCCLSCAFDCMAFDWVFLDCREGGIYPGLEEWTGCFCKACYGDSCKAVDCGTCCHDKTSLESMVVSDFIYVGRNM